MDQENSAGKPEFGMEIGWSTPEEIRIPATDVYEEILHRKTHLIFPLAFMPSKRVKLNVRLQGILGP